MPEGDEGETLTVPFGKAAIRREGSDVTIVAYSMMARKAKKKRLRNWKKRESPAR